VDIDCTKGKFENWRDSQVLEILLYTIITKLDCRLHSDIFQVQTLLSVMIRLRTNNLILRLGLTQQSPIHSTSYTFPTRSNSRKIHSSNPDNNLKTRRIISPHTTTHNAPPRSSSACANPRKPSIKVPKKIKVPTACPPKKNL